MQIAKGKNFPKPRVAEGDAFVVKPEAEDHHKVRTRLCDLADQFVKTDSKIVLAVLDQ